MHITVTDILGLTALLLAASWLLLPVVWAKMLLYTGRRWARLRQAWEVVGDTRWHYLRGGNGPVLVALHGFGADADNWLRISRPLTRIFDVVAPDLPGFGLSSSKTRLNFDIDSQVDRLHEFLRALDVEPQLIIGSSMGGWIATKYAARYPGRIKALWLQSPLGVRHCRKAKLMDSIELDENSPFQVKNVAQFRQQVLEPMFGKIPRIPYPLKIHYARKAKKLSISAPEMFRQVRSGTESLEEIAAQIRIPVLLQWGAADKAVDVSGAAALQKALGNVTVRIQEGVGHLPMLETPLESTRYFFEFCKQQQLFEFAQTAGSH